MRIALTALAVVQLIIAGLVGMVGLFADGGGVFSRVLLAVIHPVAAVALIVALAARAPKPRLDAIAVALALASVAADAYISLAILAGAIRGDAWLPLAFAAIPAIAVAYLGARLLRKNNQGSV